VKLGVELGDGIGVSVAGGKGVEVFKTGLDVARIVALRLTAGSSFSAFPQATRARMMHIMAPTNLPQLSFPVRISFTLNRE
jgi:hypothetical protein